MLDDAYAGGARCDGLELAADLGGGVGLEVEAVVLGESAGEEDVDAGAGGGLAVGRGPQGGQVAGGQAEQADGAGLQGGAAAGGGVVECLVAQGGAPAGGKGG